MDFTWGLWNSWETEWRLPVFHFQTAFHEFSPRSLVISVVATPQRGLESSKYICSAHSAKPSLSPVMVNRSWAQPVEIGGARGTIQDDAGGLHPQHFSILLIHDLIYAFCDPICSPAILEHFRIEQKAAVAILLVQGGEYFLP